MSKLYIQLVTIRWQYYYYSLMDILFSKFQMVEPTASRQLRVSNLSGFANQAEFSQWFAIAFRKVIDALNPSEIYAVSTAITL